MNYYNIKLPALDADTEYYLANGYGGVATVRGVDINIMGKIDRTPDKVCFESWVIINGIDWVYKVEDIHVKFGNLLQPIALKQLPLRLGFKTRHGTDITFTVLDDLSIKGNLWVCKKDYTPHRIKSIKDNEMYPYTIYKLSNNTFWSTTSIAEFPEDDVYTRESEVEFYCKCGKVSDKSMADIMRVSDEELDDINGMLAQLKQYMTDHNIVMVYDDYDNITRVYRNSGLPDGYEVIIDDDDDENRHPWSMEVPTSALRMTKDILFDRINDRWTVQLNYKKPEPKKEADDE